MKTNVKNNVTVNVNNIFMVEIVININENIPEQIRNVLNSHKLIEKEKVEFNIGDQYRELFEVVESIIDLAEMFKAFGHKNIWSDNDDGTVLTISYKVKNEKCMNEFSKKVKEFFY